MLQSLPRAILFFTHQRIAQSEKTETYLYYMVRWRAKQGVCMNDFSRPSEKCASYIEANNLKISHWIGAFLLGKQSRR